MNEKPRLKDTEEILSSLRKRKPDSGTTAGKPVSPEEEELISSMLDRDGRPVAESRPARPRKPAASSKEKRQAQEQQPDGQTEPGPEREPAPTPRRGNTSRRQPAAEPELVDRSPLDFSRFELPTRGAQRGGATATPITISLEDGGEPADSAAQTPRRSVSRRKPPASGGRTALREQAPPPVEEPAPAAPEPKEYIFEELERRPPERPQTETAPDPQPSYIPNQAVEASERETPPETRGAERGRFLDELSSVFEEQFEKRFESRKSEAHPERREMPDINKEKPVAPRQSARSQRPQGQNMTGQDSRKETGGFFDAHAEPEEALPPTDSDADRAALSFLQAFQEDVRKEERGRTEESKESLAEKFMRERQQYLRELGVGEALPDSGGFAGEEKKPQREPVEPPPRRRLEIDIDPEMHKSPQREPARPVTYSPAGAVSPQTDGSDRDWDMPDNRHSRKGAVPGRRHAPETGADPDGKKTGEQLLFELATESKLRPLREYEQRVQMEEEAAKAAKAKPAFEFLPPDKAGEKETQQETRGKRLKLPGRTAIIASAAAVVALIIIAVPIYTWYSLYGKAEEPNSGIEGEPTGYLEETERFTVRETRRFDTTREFGDVVVRQSGIEFQNASVRNMLVIEDITTPGEVRLRDISVGDAIYIRDCAVDSLRLENVQADRVVVNNNRSAVQVFISGNSKIGTVELKTASGVSQADLSGGAEGIRNLLIKNSDAAQALPLTLTGLDLQTLTTEGGCVLNFENDARVEALSAEGALSLRGAARIVNLAVRSAAGESKLSLHMENVAVTNLNVKSPAEMELKTQVDFMAVAGPLSVTGTGGVGLLTVNPGTSSTRLGIELSGVNVQSLIVNTQSRVDILGGARVNELTANESTYIMGGKVNYLIPKASNVIYETEPDKIAPTEGVGRPQSVADNPNLDLTASREAMPLINDATHDDLLTTCGHAREAGGFVRGDGSVDSPFEVSNPAQLAHVAQHLSSHFIQTASINIADDSRFASTFPVIGGEGKAFGGSYSGNGYRITNLRISSGGESVGLFGDNTGSITGVHIASGDIQSTANSRAYVGGVVGLNMSSGTVTACANGARVTGNSGGYAGGVVGYNYGGRIRDSYNSARVMGATQAGGVVGVNHTSGVVTGCYNAGLIEGDGQGRVGAVAGLNEEATVTNCYFLTETAPNGVGNGVGTVAERTAAEMRSPQMVADLSAGAEASPWAASSGGDYEYPVLNVPARAGA